MSCWGLPTPNDHEDTERSRSAPERFVFVFRTLFKCVYVIFKIVSGCNFLSWYFWASIEAIEVYQNETIAVGAESGGNFFVSMTCAVCLSFLSLSLALVKIGVASLSVLSAFSSLVWLESKLVVLVFKVACGSCFGSNNWRRCSSAIFVEWKKTRTIIVSAGFYVVFVHT